MYSASGGEVEPTRCGTHHYAVTPLGLFKAKDHYIFIIALDPQWASLCEAMGRADLIEEPGFATNAERNERPDEVIAIIQDWLDSMPSYDAIFRALEEKRVPCAPILSISETMAQPHLTERGTLRTVSDPVVGDVQLPGMPLRFSSFPNNIPLEAAHLGQHNAAVLSDTLGYSTAKIEQLRQDGVLHSDPST
jgi:crotonobetainyl-CoA:carnitine CoA-transferase CaiB-like acyl-CoA transferase